MESYIKNAVVVGDLSGVGYQVAEKLFKDGIVVWGRTPEGEYYLHNEIMELDDRSLTNGEPVRVPCGISIGGWTPANIDTVIDCGCINQQCWAEDENSGEVFMKLMENNNKKMFDLYHDFIKDLRKNKGLFVTIASVAARFPMSCTSAYNSSKASMVMQSRVFAREEHRKIQDDNYCSFITVSPILIPETNMVESLKYEYMKKRGVIDKSQADKDFQSELINRKALKLSDVVDFLYHLVMTNRSLSRSISGSDLQLGSQI